MVRRFSEAEICEFEALLALRKTAFVACPKGLPSLELLLEYMNADRRVKELTEFEVTPLKVTYFGNNERLPTIMDSVREKNVIITQGFTQGEDPKDTHLSGEIKDLEWTIKTVRTCKANSISLDIGFFPYGRSDKQFKGGQTILCKAFFDGLEKQAGNKAKGILTYDLHNDAIAGFVDNFSMDALSAAPLFAMYFRNLPELKGIVPVVLAPDAGGLKRAEDFRDMLGGDFAYTHKERIQGGKAKIKEIISKFSLKGRVVIVIDDMISGGGTASEIADACYKLQAKQVYFAATHVLVVKTPGEPDPEDVFRKSGLKIVGGDTVLRSPEYLWQNQDWFTQITTAGMKSDFMLGHYFGDNFRNIRERYHDLGVGSITYDSSEGRLMPAVTKIRDEGGLIDYAHQGIAYATLGDLKLPNPAYLKAWARADAFKNLHNQK